MRLILCHVEIHGRLRGPHIVPTLLCARKETPRTTSSVVRMLLNLLVGLLQNGILHEGLRNGSKLENLLNGFVWKCWVYSQWNSHLTGIMISKTIGCRGTQHFQTHSNTSRFLEHWVLKMTSRPVSHCHRFNDPCQQRTESEHWAIQKQLEARHLRTPP